MRGGAYLRSRGAGVFFMRLSHCSTSSRSALPLACCRCLTTRPAQSPLPTHRVNILAVSSPLARTEQVQVDIKDLVKMNPEWAPTAVPELSSGFNAWMDTLPFGDNFHKHLQEKKDKQVVFVSADVWEGVSKPLCSMRVAASLFRARTPPSPPSYPLSRPLSSLLSSHSLLPPPSFSFSFLSPHLFH
jgi:hypothetical protein